MDQIFFKTVLKQGKIYNSQKLTIANASNNLQQFKYSYVYYLRSHNGSQFTLLHDYKCTNRTFTAALGLGAILNFLNTHI